MKPNDDGTFEVAPGEKIIFKVTRKKKWPCKAAFDPRDWAACGTEAQPDDQTKVKTCTAPAKVCSWCSMTITVDFTTDSPGGYDPDDQYTVVITGETGKPATDTFSPPPVEDGETYKFHVSKP